MCGGGRRGECDLLIPPADCDLHVALKLGRHYHAGQTAELNQIDMISFLCSACKWMIQFKRFQPLYCIDSDLLCTTTHWFCNSALRYIKEPVVRLPEHDKTRFQILQKAKNITFSLKWGGIFWINYFLIACRQIVQCNFPLIKCEIKVKSFVSCPAPKPCRSANCGLWRICIIPLLCAGDLAAMLGKDL